MSNSSTDTHVDSSTNTSKNTDIPTDTVIRVTEDGMEEINDEDVENDDFDLEATGVIRQNG